MPRRKDSVCESAAGRSIDWARDVAQQQMQAVQTAPIEEAATRSPIPAGDDVMNLQRLATMSADMCGLS